MRTCTTRRTCPWQKRGSSTHSLAPPVKKIKQYIKKNQSLCYVRHRGHVCVAQCEQTGIFNPFYFSPETMWLCSFRAVPTLTILLERALWRRCAGLLLFSAVSQTPWPTAADSVGCAVITWAPQGICLIGQHPSGSFFSHATYHRMGVKDWSLKKLSLPGAACSCWHLPAPTGLQEEIKSVQEKPWMTEQTYNQSPPFTLPDSPVLENRSLSAVQIRASTSLWCLFDRLTFPQETSSGYSRQLPPENLLVPFFSFLY